MSLEKDIAQRFSKSLRSDRFSLFTSFTSLASVAIGCIALIVSISILNGYESLILDTAMRYTSHIEVRSLTDRGIQDSELVLQRIKSIEGVTSAHSILIRESLVRSRHGIAGGGIHALDKNLMAPLFRDVLTSGTLPQNNGCAVGSELARQLNVGVGDSLTFYSARRSNEVVTPVLFVAPIVGVVRTGMHTVDVSLVVMDVNHVNSVFQSSLTTGPSVIAVQLKDPNDAQTIAISVMEVVGTESVVFTWKDRFQSISSWIELQRKPIPIILGLIAVVAAFTMISTLLVSVVEKTRSISILFALGMQPKTVIRVLLIRALRLSMVGSVIGSAVALAFALIQNIWQLITLDGAVYYVSALPISLDPLPYLLIPLFSIVLAILAALIPVVVASRINPVQGLRFQ